jgi:HTH-type transcriptional regulator, sugar sensing transcriptional regulator
MKNPLKLDMQVLELLGLKEKDIHIYVTLLTLGSAPLRRIAEAALLNRGTTYDALRRLQSMNLVSFVDTKAKRHFTAEDPQKLRGLATRREVAIQEARHTLTKAIPSLRALAGSISHRPAVRYYEGDGGVRDILEDVLSHTSSRKNKTYRVYSSSGIRGLIAEAWPRYNTKRKKMNVHVKALAIGAGGKTVGMDARKWLLKEAKAPSYIFIYGRKTAYVAADDRDRLFGVIIDDDAIASTQRMIFDTIWEVL